MGRDSGSPRQGSGTLPHALWSGLVSGFGRFGFGTSDPGPINDNAAISKRNALLAIVAVAALITLPAALADVRLNDSFWIDWVWLDQFVDQLRAGVLYPRWLGLSHNGLGSPVFYYYPPIAFYVASPFALAGMSIYASIIAAFFVAYVLSGVAMYLWLKDQAPLPLFGAVIFMIAPYHTFDFYMRGAIAESLATALLPLVMLGLRRLSHKQTGGFALTVLSYAALVATHLPLTLLASLFLFVPYAILLSRGRLTAVLPLAAALATGLALASIYLIPALLLEPYRDSAKLWQIDYLQPRNWTLWRPGIGQTKAYHAILLILGSLAIPLIGLIVRHRSWWAIYGLACGLVAAGVFPAIWSLPGLPSVQFPFRLLPLAEFALATSVALLPWRQVPFAVTSISLLSMTGFLVTATPADEPLSMAEFQALHPDVPENLPPGDRPYSWPSRWALEIAAQHRVPTFRNGVTVEPVYYFPAWQVRCDGRPVRTFPERETSLLAYHGRNCARALTRTGAERAGAIISALTLLCLLLWQIGPAWRQAARRRRVTAAEAANTAPV